MESDVKKNIKSSKTCHLEITSTGRVILVIIGWRTVWQCVSNPVHSKKKNKKNEKNVGVTI
jgi:hypothetical protein